MDAVEKLLYIIGNEKTVIANRLSATVQLRLQLEQAAEVVILSSICPLLSTNLRYMFSKLSPLLKNSSLIVSGMAAMPTDETESVTATTLRVSSPRDYHQFAITVASVIGFLIGLMSPSHLIAECVNLLLLEVESGPGICPSSTTRLAKASTLQMDSTNVDSDLRVCSAADIQVAMLAAIQRTIEAIVLLSTSRVSASTSGKTSSAQSLSSDDSDTATEQPVLSVIAKSSESAACAASDENSRLLPLNDRLAALDHCRLLTRLLAVAESTVDLGVLMAASSALRPLANIQFTRDLVTAPTRFSASGRVAVSFLTSQKFMNLVDTLIGWALDNNSALVARRSIGMLLSRFHGAWRVNGEYALQLSNQLASHLIRVIGSITTDLQLAATAVDEKLSAAITAKSTNEATLLGHHLLLSCIAPFEGDAAPGKAVSRLGEVERVLRGDSARQCVSLMSCFEAVLCAIRQTGFACSGGGGSVVAVRLRLLATPIRDVLARLSMLVETLSRVSANDVQLMPSSDHTSCLTQFLSAGVSLLQAILHPCLACSSISADTAPFCLTTSALLHSLDLSGLVRPLLVAIAALVLRLSVDSEDCAESDSLMAHILATVMQMYAQNPRSCEVSGLGSELCCNKPESSMWLLLCQHRFLPVVMLAYRLANLMLSGCLGWQVALTTASLVAADFSRKSNDLASDRVFMSLSQLDLGERVLSDLEMWHEALIHCCDFLKRSGESLSLNAKSLSELAAAVEFYNFTHRSFLALFQSSVRSPVSSESAVPLIFCEDLTVRGQLLATLHFISTVPLATVGVDIWPVAKQLSFILFAFCIPLSAPIDHILSIASSAHFNAVSNKLGSYTITKDLGRRVLLPDLCVRWLIELLGDLHALLNAIGADDSVKAKEKRVKVVEQAVDLLCLLASHRLREIQLQAAHGISCLLASWLQLPVLTIGTGVIHHVYNRNISQTELLRSLCERMVSVATVGMLSTDQQVAGVHSTIFATTSAYLRDSFILDTTTVKISARECQKSWEDIHFFDGHVWHMQLDTQLGLASITTGQLAKLFEWFAPPQKHGATRKTLPSVRVGLQTSARVQTTAPMSFAVEQNEVFTAAFHTALAAILSGEGHRGSVADSAKLQTFPPEQSCKVLLECVSAATIQYLIFVKLSVPSLGKPSSLLAALEAILNRWCVYASTSDFERGSSVAFSMFFRFLLQLERRIQLYSLGIGSSGYALHTNHEIPHTPSATSVHEIAARQFFTKNAKTLSTFMTKLISKAHVLSIVRSSSISSSSPADDPALLQPWQLHRNLNTDRACMWVWSQRQFMIILDSWSDSMFSMYLLTSAALAKRATVSSLARDTDSTVPFATPVVVVAALLPSSNYSATLRPLVLSRPLATVSTTAFDDIVNTVDDDDVNEKSSSQSAALTNINGPTTASLPTLTTLVRMFVSTVRQYVAFISSLGCRVGEWTELFCGARETVFSANASDWEPTSLADIIMPVAPTCWSAWRFSWPSYMSCRATSNETVSVYSIATARHLGSLIGPSFPNSLAANSAMLPTLSNLLTCLQYSCSVLETSVSTADSAYVSAASILKLAVQCAAAVSQWSYCMTDNICHEESGPNQINLELKHVVCDVADPLSTSWQDLVGLLQFLESQSRVFIKPYTVLISGLPVDSVSRDLYSNISPCSLSYEAAWQMLEAATFGDHVAIDAASQNMLQLQRSFTEVVDSSTDLPVSESIQIFTHLHALQSWSVCSILRDSSPVQKPPGQQFFSRLSNRFTSYAASDPFFDISAANILLCVSALMAAPLSLAPLSAFAVRFPSTLNDISPGDSFVHMPLSHWNDGWGSCSSELLNHEFDNLSMVGWNSILSACRVLDMAHYKSIEHTFSIGGDHVPDSVLQHCLIRPTLVLEAARYATRHHNRALSRELLTCLLSTFPSNSWLSDPITKARLSRIAEPLTTTIQIEAILADAYGCDIALESGVVLERLAVIALTLGQHSTSVNSIHALMVKSPSFAPLLLSMARLSQCCAKSQLQSLTIGDSTVICQTALGRLNTFLVQKPQEPNIVTLYPVSTAFTCNPLAFYERSIGALLAITACEHSENTGTASVRTGFLHGNVQLDYAAWCYRAVALLRRPAHESVASIAQMLMRSCSNLLVDGPKVTVHTNGDVQLATPASFAFPFASRTPLGGSLANDNESLLELSLDVSEPQLSRVAELILTGCLNRVDGTLCASLVFTLRSICAFGVECIFANASVAKSAGCDIDEQCLFDSIAEKLDAVLAPARDDSDETIIPLMVVSQLSVVVRLNVLSSIVALVRQRYGIVLQWLKQALIADIEFLQHDRADSVAVLASSVRVIGILRELGGHLIPIILKQLVRIPPTVFAQLIPTLFSFLCESSLAQSTSEYFISILESLAYGQVYSLVHTVCSTLLSTLHIQTEAHRVQLMGPELVSVTPSAVQRMNDMKNRLIATSPLLATQLQRHALLARDLHRVAFLAHDLWHTKLCHGGEHDGAAIADPANKVPPSFWVIDWYSRCKWLADGDDAPIEVVPSIAPSVHEFPLLPSMNCASVAETQIATAFPKTRTARFKPSRMATKENINTGKSINVRLNASLAIPDALWLQKYLQVFEPLLLQLRTLAIATLGRDSISVDAVSGYPIPPLFSLNEKDTKAYAMQQVEWLIIKECELSPCDIKFRQQYSLPILLFLRELHNPPVAALRCVGLKKPHTLSLHAFTANTLPLRMKQWLESLLSKLPELQKPSSAVLDLSHVAPRLTAINVWSTPELPLLIPGVGTRLAIHPQQYLSHESDHVGLRSFAPCAVTLHTKTRPRKLHLIGTDGRSYAFLVKSNEDLRIDARAMHWANLWQTFWSGSASGRRERQHCSLDVVRTYAVMPLSVRAGLIQWVDHSIPLFDLYKEWQATCVASDVESGSASAVTSMFDISSPVLPSSADVVAALAYHSPASVFSARVTAALARISLPASTPRSDWPPSVSERVFAEMREATPADLVRRRLLAIATSPSEHDALSHRYASSLACGSVFGHLCGVGDRHLGNMLLDRRTGELIHIDYAVCQDRGLRLRVPELVPFRLTGNLVLPLGPTALCAASTFSCSATRVLSAMRRHAHVALSLAASAISEPTVVETTSRTQPHKNHLNNGYHHMDSLQAASEPLDACVAIAVIRQRVFEIPIHSSRCIPTLPKSHFLPVGFVQLPMKINVRSLFAALSQITSDLTVLFGHVLPLQLRESDIKSQLVILNRDCAQKQCGVSSLESDLRCHTESLMRIVPNLAATPSGLAILRDCPVRRAAAEKSLYELSNSLRPVVDRHRHALESLFIRRWGNVDKPHVSEGFEFVGGDDDWLINAVSVAPIIDLGRIIDPSTLIMAASTPSGPTPGSMKHVYRVALDVLPCTSMHLTQMALSLPEAVLSTVAPTIVLGPVVSITSLLDTLALSDARVFALDQRQREAERLVLQALFGFRAQLVCYLDSIVPSFTDVGISNKLRADSVLAMTQSHVWYLRAQRLAQDPFAISQDSLDIMLGNLSAPPLVWSLQHRSVRGVVFKKAQDVCDINTGVSSASVDVACTSMSAIGTEVAQAQHTHQTMEQQLIQELVSHSGSSIDSQSKVSLTRERCDLVWQWVESSHPDAPTTSSVGENAIIAIERMQIDCPWFAYLANLAHQCIWRRRVQLARTVESGFVLNLASETMELTSFLLPINAIGGNVSFTPFSSSFVASVRQSMLEAHFPLLEMVRPFVDQLLTDSIEDVAIIGYTKSTLGHVLDTSIDIYARCELSRVSLRDAKFALVESQQSRSVLENELTQLRCLLQAAELRLCDHIRASDIPTLSQFLLSVWRPLRGLFAVALRACPAESTLSTVLTELKDDHERILIVITGLMRLSSLEWRSQLDSCHKLSLFYVIDRLKSNWLRLFFLDDLMPRLCSVSPIQHEDVLEFCEQWPSYTVAEGSFRKPYQLVSDDGVLPAIEAANYYLAPIAFSGVGSSLPVFSPPSGLSRLSVLSARAYSIHHWIRMRDKLCGIEAAVFKQAVQRQFHGISFVGEKHRLEDSKVLPDVRIANVPLASSVEAHWQFLVHRATSPDVLSQLYEGWAGWI